MEKIELIIEILKELLKHQEYLSTTELYRKLKSKGVLKSTTEKTERRKLLRSLITLEELGYIKTKEKKKEKLWKIEKERFKSLFYLSFEEIASFIFILSFYPKTYKEIPLFKEAFEIISRYEKELGEEEREILKSSFERVPTFNERTIKIEEKLFKLLITSILKRQQIYIQYKNKFYKILPLKIFNYNGLFYLSSLTEKKSIKTFLLGRIEKIIPMETRLPEGDNIKREELTFEIPKELPFLFGVIFSKNYATETEIRKEIKFSPFQFHIEKTETGILTYLVGFTGKRFASWFLVEKAIKLISPNPQIIEIARKKELKKNIKGISYQLRENQKRFKEFLRESQKLLNQKLKIYKKNDE